MYDLRARVPTQTTPNAALTAEEMVEAPASTVARAAAAESTVAREVGKEATPESAREAARGGRPPVDADLEAEIEAGLAGPIKAYAMFWSRDKVDWTQKPNLFGEQVKGAKQVNFTQQAGVYILHDGARVVYVGQAGVGGTLGARLYAHTRSRLSGRWDRFSWFGVRGVKDNGTLADMPKNGTDVTSFITALEAVLIEALEPPQNRRAGEWFNEGIEWQQKEDPAIERKRRKAVADEIVSKLGQG
jgi:hypothetical protein